MYTEHVHVILYRVRGSRIKSDQIDILPNPPQVYIICSLIIITLIK